MQSYAAIFIYSSPDVPTTTSLYKIPTVFDAAGNNIYQLLSTIIDNRLLYPKFADLEWVNAVKAPEFHVRYM